MLVKLHCNEFSSQKCRNTLGETGAQLQSADTELHSLTRRLAASRQRYQQIQEEYHVAKDNLHKQVGFCCFKTTA